MASEPGTTAEGALGSPIIHHETSLPAMLTLLGVAVTASSFFFYGLYNIFLHPLRRYPGPKLWAVSRIPYSYLYMSGTGHQRILKLHQQYGDIVRVAPDQLSFLNPDAWKEIMGHRKSDEGENKKAPGFYVEEKESVIGADRQRHGRQRRLLAHAFSTQIMQLQEPLITQHIDALLAKLKDTSREGSKIDIVKWLNFTTFDIMGDLSFGESFGCLREGKYHSWVALIFSSIKYTAFTYILYQFPLLRGVHRLMIPNEVKRQNDDVNDFTMSHVNKRLQLGSDRPDFLHYMSREHNSIRLTHSEIVANARTLVIAGSETTATALSAVFFYLARSPRVTEKLAAELRSSFETEEQINLISVQKLTYLRVCIEEGLRLFPPVPGAIPRVTPPEGMPLFGEYVPGGIMLDIWHWPMYHNPEYFKDAEEYVPERWLGDPAYESDRLDALQPFSFGPRNCLGKNLAFVEMKLILARIVWNFKLKLDRESEDWLEQSKVYALWEKPGMDLYFTPRKEE